MTTFTAHQVRTWAKDNNIDCPRVGRVPQHIIDAYLAAVHGVTINPAVPAVPVDPADPAPQPDADSEPMMWVTVNIPGDPDIEGEIATHLLEAVWLAYESGRRAERTRIAATLGMTE
jgi:hypothetical protein